MLWYIPILIFVARVCDVSIGTFRTMLVIAGHKYLAAALGFVEVIIWILAVGGTLQYIQTSLWTIVGYAGGFAAGVLVGMWLEERIALGFRAVRVIAPTGDDHISDRLRGHGYRVTRVDGYGRGGPVEIAFLIVRRRSLRPLLKTIRSLEPESFITVERVEPPSSAAAESATDSRFARRLVERAMPMRK